MTPVEILILAFITAIVGASLGLLTYYAVGVIRGWF